MGGWGLAGVCDHINRFSYHNTEICLQKASMRIDAIDAERV